MKRIAYYTMIAALVLFTGAQAKASQITLDISFDWGNLTKMNLFVNGQTSSGHYAGSFAGRDVASDFATDVYCVEITQGIGQGSYTFDINELADIDIRYQKAGWLMDTFSEYTDTAQSAAVQVAVWEVIHEQSGGFDLYNGSFRLDASKPVAYSSLLNQISTGFLNGDYTQFDMSRFATYTSTTAQDLIGLHPPVTEPVPEPMTMTLFGSGIAALAAYGRRKR